MWKVTNNENYKYLNKFDANIIQPIFNIILDISATRTRKIISVNFWKNATSYKGLNKDIKKLIDYMMGVKVKEEFKEVVLRLINNYSCAEVNKIFNIYQLQNSYIKYKYYAIQEVVLPDEIKKIFIEFYYNRFFNDEKIWNVLVKSEYSKTTFHEKFKEENRISVCPYCDVDTFVTNSNNNVEHFFPKAKFPLVSMNPYNLISSCIACNKAHEGKGEESPKYPIVMPYSEEIKSVLEFEIDFFKRKINLINKGSKQHKNYLELLKLNERYQEKVVYDSLDQKAESIFNICTIAGTVNMEVLENYLREKSKNENLMVAINHLIKKYPRYKTMSP